MPTPSELFHNLSEATKASVQMFKEKGILLAREATVNERIDTCLSCEHLINTLGVNRCNLCGCGLILKVRLAASSCPISKWSVEKIADN